MKKTILLFLFLTRAIFAESQGPVTIKVPLVTTTNNTPTTAYSLPIANNSTYFLTGSCTVRETDAAGRAMFEKKVGIYQEAAGGAQMQGGVTSSFAESSDLNAALTWTTSSGNAILQVTGDTGKTFNWTCLITYIQGS